MTHIFLSYSHQDRHFVIDLELLIEEAGFEIWTDLELSPGENWKTGIDGAIERSFAVIVIMTPAARHSEYVTYEWAYALGYGITVIPILLQDTQLHPKLDDLHYIDFTEDITTPLKSLLKRLAVLEQEFLHKQLRNKHWEERIDAVEKLAERRDKSAVPYMSYMLFNDRSRRKVRPAVKRALQTIDTLKAREALKNYRD